MKVAVQILSTLKEPSTRNIEAIKNTYIALTNSLSEKGKLKHTYDFYFYYGGYEDQPETTVEKDEVVEHCFNIKIPIAESIYNTFEKGIEALKIVDGYDFYVRCNISCYIHIPVLDKLLIYFRRDEVYSSSINSYVNDENYYNDLYPRGDFAVFSSFMRRGILENAPKYIRCDYALENRLNVPHVDDCMFGLCIMDTLGKNYYNNLKALHYNYIPSYKEEEPAVWVPEYIVTRVKTIPPGINFSGYSWVDNDYRKMDVYKMNLINDKIKNMDFSKITINLANSLSDKKPIVFITAKFAGIDAFKSYLKQRKTK